MAKVSAIMNTSVPTLKKEAGISDAARLMVDNPLGCVVVVEGERPIGIITESDIVRSLVSEKINLKEKAAKIMSSPITAISPNTSLEKANKIIDTKHFRRYPVVKDEKLIGVVTENSIVQAINDNVSFHRNVQNAVLIIFVLFEFFIFVLYGNLIKFF